MLARIMGVFKLDVKTFEEIEHDTNLTLPAALIVILVSLVSGVGNGLFNGFVNKTFLSGFFGSLIAVLLGWLLWSAVTWFVGTRLFHGEADLGQMLRVIGFAYLPLLLSIIPCVGGVIGIIWAILAGFIAIRQGLDLDDMRAFFTVALGALAYLVLMGVVNLII
jgi:small basic protein